MILSIKNFLCLITLLALHAVCVAIPTSLAFDGNDRYTTHAWTEPGSTPTNIRIRTGSSSGETINDIDVKTQFLKFSGYTSVSVGAVKVQKDAGGNYTAYVLFNGYGTWGSAKKFGIVAIGLGISSISAVADPLSYTKSDVINGNVVYTEVSVTANSIDVSNDGSVAVGGVVQYSPTREYLYALRWNTQQGTGWSDIYGFENGSASVSSKCAGVHITPDGSRMTRVGVTDFVSPSDRRAVVESWDKDGTDKKVFQYGGYDCRVEYTSMQTYGLDSVICVSGSQAPNTTSIRSGFAFNLNAKTLDNSNSFAFGLNYTWSSGSSVNTISQGSAVLQIGGISHFIHRLVSSDNKTHTLTSTSTTPVTNLSNVSYTRVFDSPGQLGMFDYYEDIWVSVEKSNVDSKAQLVMGTGSTESSQKIDIKNGSIQVQYDDVLAVFCSKSLRGNPTNLVGFALVKEYVGTNNWVPKMCGVYTLS
jgi:hypothetical protein